MYELNFNHNTVRTKDIGSDRYFSFEDLRRSFPGHNVPMMADSIFVNEGSTPVQVVSLATAVDIFPITEDMADSLKMAFPRPSEAASWLSQFCDLEEDFRAALKKTERQLMDALCECHSEDALRPRIAAIAAELREADDEF